MPHICIRCQNQLTRRDHLRLAIQWEIKRSYGSATAVKLVKAFTCSEFSQAVIEAETWTLIEKGIAQVDDKGIITLCKE